MRDLVTAWVSPLGTALFLWALSLLWNGWAVSRRHHSAGAVKVSTKSPRLLGGLGLAWLLLWSNPIASDALRGSIENTAGPRLVSELPAVQVAVVLGGGVSGPRPPQRPDPDLGSAADRLWHAARIYHEGKARTLLLSGGTTRTGDGSEAQAMRRFLLDLGVPDQALLLEDASVNTTSNATLTAQLLRQQNIEHVLLVTSALHMPRARAALEATGLRVYPAPTDFEVIPMPMALHRLLPDAHALLGSARAMKELVGRWSGN